MGAACMADEWARWFLSKIGRLKDSRLPPADSSPRKWQRLFV
jgi:hypothetical protein